jgi:hypothetical protein
MAPQRDVGPSVAEHPESSPPRPRRPVRRPG